MQQKKVYEKAIKNWPVDDRPREKLLKKGARALSNSELLAILLRTGTSGISAIDLARKLATLEKKYDDQFKVVFDAIRALMSPPEKPRKKIGFKVEECRATYGRKRKHNNKWYHNLQFCIEFFACPVKCLPCEMLVLCKE